VDVVLALPADLPAWLALAAEVEPLFGPLVADPGFRAALARNMARQTAFCIREHDGAPGTPLMGGLLFSATHAPSYRIGWLAVHQRWRRQRVARTLIEHWERFLPRRPRRPRRIKHEVHCRGLRPLRGLT
jgi:ribosomal protein S18 acetylase RimI-like enzyme